MTTDNVYYNIHSYNNNHLKVPVHMLEDEDLACVYYRCDISHRFVRIYENFQNYDYSVTLVNLSDEDLAYLVLSDIKFTKTWESAIASYDELFTTGYFCDC